MAANLGKRRWEGELHTHSRQQGCSACLMAPFGAEECQQQRTLEVSSVCRTLQPFGSTQPLKTQTNVPRSNVPEAGHQALTARKVTVACIPGPNVGSVNGRHCAWVASRWMQGLDAPIFLSLPLNTPVDFVPVLLEMRPHTPAHPLWPADSGSLITWYLAPRHIPFITHYSHFQHLRPTFLHLFWHSFPFFYIFLIPKPSPFTLHLDRAFL
jgi:hypothetical protein